MSSFGRWKDYRHHKTWPRRTRNLAFYKRLQLTQHELLFHGKLQIKVVSQCWEMVTCCFLSHHFLQKFKFYIVYPLRARATLMPLFSNPQFSELELQWGNCTGIGGTRQNKSLGTNPQSDSQGPVGSSESWGEIRESFAWVSPCISACVGWPS